MNNANITKPILSAELARIHLHITAILQGQSRGKVFVDNLIHPQTAYIASMEAHYLAGDPNNQTFNLALNAQLPRDTYFVLFCDPDQWAGSLDVILENTYAVQAPRHYYVLKELKITDWQSRVPNGFTMQSIHLPMAFLTSSPPKPGLWLEIARVASDIYTKLSTWAGYTT